MLNYLGFFVATPLGGEGVTAGSEMTSNGEEEEEQCPLRVLACFDVSAGLFGAGQGADCSSPCPPSWKEADYPKSSL